MNGISTDALVGLAGVALGAVVSLVGVWIEGRREARRIADRRHYEWVKERLDKVEDHISRWNLTSYNLKNAALEVLEWTAIWWQAPRLERPEITGTVQQHLDALASALEKGEAFREEPPEILFGSLEPQILGGVYELHQSFSRLWAACSLLSFERGEAIQAARDSNDLRPMQAWKKRCYDEVINEYARFQKMHGYLVDAMRRSLTLQSRYRPPSWVQRLREWWGRR